MIFVDTTAQAPPVRPPHRVVLTPKQPDQILWLHHGICRLFPQEILENQMAVFAPGDVYVYWSQGKTIGQTEAIKLLASLLPKVVDDNGNQGSNGAGDEHHAG